ncbi:MAG: hypothetical protein HOL01_06630 [Planctomycetaceae bacterium]|jgi:hypothetical protein|nr:hypothetical protein [Planctomycetaceae bacterium]MBT6483422.1 hypothetical protein [Planctomycetaceae bacterium]MBT6494214.1 hypothetical protein [Planctomycetaceae bacterium]
MSDFPREFSVETAPQPTHYTLADDYYVVLGAGADQADLNVEFHIEDGDLTVCRKRHGETSLAAPATAAGPVYRLGEHGPLAVPTGKVFVRFTEQTKLEDRQEDIERTGFMVNQILSYAPHAGWIEPKSGKIVDAINRFEELKYIPGVAAVEPQMLMESQRR